MRQFAHRLKNSAGAEIAEAALVMPVVFVFLLGIIWFGRAFNIYSTIQQAAQQGAIVAARPSCATCGAGTGGSDFPSDATVTNAISAVLKASSLNPALIPPNSNPPNPQFCSFPPSPPGPPPPPTGCSVASTTGNITICREVLLDPPAQGSSGQSPPSPVCGTLVSFQYPFSFYLPFTSLNLSQVTMNAQAQSRMEN